MKIDFPTEDLDPEFRAKIEASEPVVVVMALRSPDGFIHTVSRSIPQAAFKVTDCAYALGKCSGTAARLVRDIVSSLESAERSDVIAEVKAMFLAGTLICAEGHDSSSINLKEGRGQSDRTSL